VVDFATEKKEDMMSGPGTSDEHADRWAQADVCVCVSFASANRHPGGWALLSACGPVCFSLIPWDRTLAELNECRSVGTPGVVVPAS
jgi:hypothetical protein